MKKIILVLLCWVIGLALAPMVLGETPQSQDQPKEEMQLARGGHHPGPTHHPPPGRHYGGGPYYHHGGCFIATAAYGNVNHPNVSILRQFRDRWLLTNRAGEAFIIFYYENSPAIAEFIERHEFLKPIARVVLLPVVGISYCLNCLAKEGG